MHGLRVTEPVITTGLVYTPGFIDPDEKPLVLYVVGVLCPGHSVAAPLLPLGSGGWRVDRPHWSRSRGCRHS